MSRYFSGSPWALMSMKCRSVMVFFKAVSLLRRRFASECSILGLRPIPGGRRECRLQCADGFVGDPDYFSSSSFIASCPSSRVLRLSYTCIATRIAVASSVVNYRIAYRTYWRGRTQSAFVEGSLQ